MSKFIRSKLYLAFFAFAIVGAACGVPSGASASDVSSAAPASANGAEAPTPWQFHVNKIADREADALAILNAHNARRLARGLAPLRLDPNLCTIAFGYASQMVSRNFIGHWSPEGQSAFQRLDLGHVRYSSAAENIAFDRDANAAAQSLFDSPDHRENILDAAYTRVGIVALPTADGELVVEDFTD